jgi:bacterioferritin
MTANSKTIERLQTALSMELAAVHQYMLHAHVLEDWGLDGLAAKMRSEMQEELGHAQEYTRRIMFLGGDPQLKAAKVPQRAQSLEDMFSADLADEEHAIRFYTEASQVAHEDGDIGSRMLFEKIVIDEEGHKAWLDLQLNLLRKIGEQAYFAKYMTVASEETT